MFLHGEGLRVSHSIEVGFELKTEESWPVKLGPLAWHGVWEHRTIITLHRCIFSTHLIHHKNKANL